MRRIGWTVLSLLVVAGLAGPADSVAQGEKIVAVVLKANNDVRQRPAGTEDWQQARRGQPLAAGHELRTGDDSFCALIFQDDQSLLKITSNTEVTLNIEEATGGRFSKRIWVGVGGIWAKAAKQEDTKFEIETPTSVASVKGSSCYDMVDLSGWTSLFVLDGIFDFSNSFGQVTLGAGFRAFSNGVDPPDTSATNPNDVPTFGGNGGVEGGEGFGEMGVQELGIGLRDEDGTEKTLIIRVQEAEE